MPAPIHLIYASTSGNTEVVMETVAEVLAKQGFVTRLHRAEQTSAHVFQESALFVFGTSTWEHGAINPFFKPLLKEMKTLNASGKYAAFAGCGDTRYEPVLFCEGIAKIKRVWETQGGKSLEPVLKINGEPYHLLETDVSQWASQVGQQFKATGSSTSHVADQILGNVKSLFRL